MDETDALAQAQADLEFRRMIMEYMQANTDALNGISAAIVSLGERVQRLEADVRALREIVGPSDGAPS